MPLGHVGLVVSVGVSPPTPPPPRPPHTPTIHDGSPANSGHSAVHQVQVLTSDVLVHLLVCCVSVVVDVTLPFTPCSMQSTVTLWLCRTGAVQLTRISLAARRNCRCRSPGQHWHDHMCHLLRLLGTSEVTCFDVEFSHFA